MAADADLLTRLGQVVPVTFEPALLVLSYIISLVGAASTLELIHRRTSRRGYYNNLLLFGAAVTMGGVAIWSMHYIGNRATILANGDPRLQIAYSAGVTVASFFVPIVVLLVAFFVVTGAKGNTANVSWWRVSTSGILSGGAICGMHYLGNASISNYRLGYATSNVIGSVVIAAAASTIALALFFVFKSSWTNSWWKRLSCAVVLAGAVSGMHWCAVMGTNYTLIHLDSRSEDSRSDLKSRNTTVIVTAVLSFSACMIIAGLAIYSARVRKGYANRAQRITLAAAVFDDQKRILVTPDGLLPSEVVTTTFLQKTGHERFSTTHPLFHWIFQASRNWGAISTLVDKMVLHLANLPHYGRNVRTAIELVDKEGHIIENYETIFCELFCVAAAALARQMNERLANVGMLWDEILTTGGHVLNDSGSSVSSSHKVRRDENTKKERRDHLDLLEKGEAQPEMLKHGHLMFLVRRVDNAQAEHLAAAGYLFAEPRQVAHIIGDRMQIRVKDFELKLRSMERYARGSMLAPGVHLGLFAVRTQFHQAGFDVLVRREARNLLPSMELPLDRLEQHHIDFLRSFHGVSMAAALHRLDRVSVADPRDTSFAAILRDAIRNLKTSVQDAVFDSAKLVPKIVQVPCIPLSSDSRPATCSMIVFSIMIPIHVRVEAPAYEFIPLQFFKVQQMVYKNCPHKAAFVRSMHRTISPLLNMTSTVDISSQSKSLFSRLKDFLLFGSWQGNDSAIHTAYNRLRRRKSRGHDTTLLSPSREHVALTSCNQSAVSLPLYNRTTSDDQGVSGLANVRADLKNPPEISVTELIDPISPTRPLPPPSKASFGGIMISQEVTVDVEVANNGGPNGDKSSDNDSDVGRKKSIRALPSAANAPIPVPFDQAIEMCDVSAVLGIGASTVQVAKEDDDVIRTFVDDLFSTCLDTPKRT